MNFSQLQEESEKQNVTQLVGNHNHHNGRPLGYTQTLLWTLYVCKAYVSTAHILLPAISL